MPPDVAVPAPRPPVTGIDGKDYPATQPPAPRRTWVRAEPNVEADPDVTGRIREGASYVVSGKQYRDHLGWLLSVWTDPTYGPPNHQPMYSLLEALDANRTLVDELTDGRLRMVDEAIARGASWADIGTAIGMTERVAAK